MFTELPNEKSSAARESQFAPVVRSNLWTRARGIRALLTTIALAFLWASDPAVASTDVLDLPAGVYVLHNHRDGNAGPPAYGLRLDGLLTGDANDIYSFDFDAPGAAMHMTFAVGSVRIYGTAYGGLDTGSAYASPEFWDIDMTYTLEAAPDVSGRWVSGGVAGSNSGAITRRSDGQAFDLVDFGGPPSFLIGFGHRAPAEVLSGWGWLNHSGGIGHLYNSDWLFEAEIPSTNLTVSITSPLDGAAFGTTPIDVGGTVSGLGGGGPPPEPAAPMLLHLPLDEGMGTIAADATANGRDFDLSSPPKEPIWMGGRFGSGLRFDGTDDRLTEPGAGLYLNGLSAFTISLWIRSDVTNVDRGVFDSRTSADGADDRLSIRYDKSGWAGGGTQVIKAALRTTAGNIQIESTSNQQTTEWQHLALVWTSGGSLQLYIDGVLDTLSHDDGPIGGQVVDVEKLVFGRGVKGNSWDGLLDEVRVYNSALVAADIAALADPLGTGSGTLTVSVNGIPAVVSGGVFLASDVPLHEGFNLATATASDSNGTASDTIEILLDTTPPDVTIDIPVVGSQTTGVSTLVEGTVVDDSPIETFELNGVLVALTPVTSRESDFSVVFPVSVGANAIVATATDSLGNVGSDQTTILGVIPDLPPTIAIDSPTEASLLTTTPIVVTGQVTGGSSPASVSVPMLVHYPFEEGLGTIAVDATGNGRDAELGTSPGADSSDPSWTAQGRIGGALSFDGVDDLFRDDQAETYLEGLTAVTIALWVKSDVTNVDRGLFDTRASADGSDDRLSMRYDKAGWGGGGTRVVKAGLRTTSGTTQVETTSNVQTTSWQHIALVWQSAGAVEIYLDGQLDSLSYDQGPRSGSLTWIEELVVGRGAKGNAWAGLIDDVRIYGAALSATDIAILADPSILEADPVVVDVEVGGVIFPAVVTDGAFEATDVTLAEGANVITATAVNLGGSASDQVSVVLDTAAPVVSIESPASGALFPVGPVSVQGRVIDTSPISSFTINGVSVPLVAISSTESEFTTTVDLVTGPLAIEAIAIDAVGLSGNSSVTIDVGVVGVAPTISISAPAPGTLTATTPTAVSGTVTGTGPVVVSIAGVSTTAIAGAYSLVVPLVEGPNALAAVATNGFGSASASVSITLDTTPPVVLIGQPADGQEFTESTITVSGGVVDATPIAALTLNGLAIAPGNSFTETSSLVEGANVITVAATDSVGNVGSASVTVTRAALEPLAIGILTPPDGWLFSTETISVVGSISDPTAAVNVNGVFATVTGTQWVAAVVPLVEGDNAIVATAIRGSDSATDSRNVNYNAPPIVSILSPEFGSVLADPIVDVEGTVDDVTALVSVNGVVASVDSGGRFVAVDVPLVIGVNPLVARAVDPMGAAGRDDSEVTRDDNVLGEIRIVMLARDRTPFLIEDSSPPKVPVVAADLAAYAQDLFDQTNLDPALFAPDLTQIATGTVVNSPIDPLAVYLYVFVSRGEIGQDVTLQEFNPQLPIGDRFAPLQPIADLSLDLQSIGQDVSLVTRLLPVDFESNGFVRFDILLVDLGGGGGGPFGP